jgi:hypothetical protein
MVGFRSLLTEANLTRTGPYQRSQAFCVIQPKIRAEIVSEAEEQPNRGQPTSSSSVAVFLSATFALWRTNERGALFTLMSPSGNGRKSLAFRRRSRPPAGVGAAIHIRERAGKTCKKENLTEVVERKP